MIQLVHILTIDPIPQPPKAFIQQLNDFKLIITGISYSQITVYRSLQNTYQQFILKGPEAPKYLYGTVYEFSSDNVYVYCTAWDWENHTLLILIFHLEKQYLVYKKNYSNSRSIRWVKEEFQAQVLILENEKVIVFDFSKYPEISEYVIQDNIQEFELIYLQKFSLLKLISNDVSQYYPLPLNRESISVDFNQKWKNSLTVRFNSKKYLKDHSGCQPVIHTCKVNGNINEFGYIYDDPGYFGFEIIDHRLLFYKYMTKPGRILVMFNVQKLIRKIQEYSVFRMVNRLYLLCIGEQKQRYLYDVRSAQVIELPQMLRIQLRSNTLIQYTEKQLIIYDLKHK